MISSHIPKLLTIEQESSEVRREFVVRVQREYVRNVLVGADNDNRALLTVDAAQLEDVGTVLEVGAVGLLVVDKLEAPLARKQNRRELFDLEVAVPLSEDRANIDHAVDVRARRGEPADRRIRGLRQEVCELAQTLSARVGKGVNAPSAISTGCVPEVHRLGVGEAHDRCGVETHADCEALGKILVGRLGGQNRRRRVMRRYTRGVTTRLHEIGLKLLRIEAAEFRAV